MKTIEIIGKNYTGVWEKTRTACRGIVIEDGKLLLSYGAQTDLWMIPGGGLEPGEDEAACCVREVAEETGLVIQVSACALEIDEYYGQRRYVDKYFFGTVTGRCERKPTALEARIGLEPRWLSVGEAMDIFSRHADYEGVNEERRGLYQREYAALRELLPDAGDR